MSAHRAAEVRARRRLHWLRAAIVLGTVVAVFWGVSRSPVGDEIAQRYRPSSPWSTPYAAEFRAAANEYPAVRASQLAAQARAESGFDPQARSGAGAEGLMQVIPDTWDRFGTDGDGDGDADPWSAPDSVHTAARYLTWISEQLDLPADDERVIAAYNAGPNAVRRAGGVPDYPETITYVERVTSWVPRYRWLDEPA